MAEMRVLVGLGSLVPFRLGLGLID